MQDALSPEASDALIKEHPDLRRNIGKIHEGAKARVELDKEAMGTFRGMLERIAADLEKMAARRT